MTDCCAFFFYDQTKKYIKHQEIKCSITIEKNKKLCIINLGNE